MWVDVVFCVNSRVGTAVLCVSMFVNDFSAFWRSVAVNIRTIYIKQYYIPLTIRFASVYVTE